MQEPSESAQISISTENAAASYANFCRATMTPEEVILDFGLNPNAFGKVLNEPVEIKNRIVVSFPAAKRLVNLLAGIVHHHERLFGEIPLDVNKRLRSKMDQDLPPET